MLDHRRGKIVEFRMEYEVSIAMNAIELINPFDATVYNRRQWLEIHCPTSHASIRHDLDTIIVAIVSRWTR